MGAALTETADKTIEVTCFTIYTLVADGDVLAKDVFKLDLGVCTEQGEIILKQAPKLFLPAHAVKQQFVFTQGGGYGHSPVRLGWFQSYHNSPPPPNRDALCKLRLHQPLQPACNSFSI